MTEVRGFTVPHRDCIKTPRGPLLLEPGKFVLVVYADSPAEAFKAAGGYLSTATPQGVCVVEEACTKADG